ncbi:TPA: phosphoribosylformylglycinamidine synthase subunit PurQ [Candidatus Bathyarchaeota archaeon]|nr:phosphoribosylformylglycinamidine synthase subunit PurQ [Candidatus Bathyarchaeota archaeon]
MQVSDIKVCIIRVGGTNCDKETERAFAEQGVRAEVHHINEVAKRGLLSEVHILVIPGGFSYGDYVRAGAILAKKILSKMEKEIKKFVDDGKPILGICNGFQVLVEAGLLPGFKSVGESPQAALATNIPIGYRCKWVYLKNENCGNCVFLDNISHGAVLRIPVAHAEGRFIFPREKEEKYLDLLYNNDQLVFRYCDEKGNYAEGKYPLNPNSSFHDIAGICNPEGTILGMMPHPERAFYGWQLPDWTRKAKPSRYGDGESIFRSVVNYVARKF